MKAADFDRQLGARIRVLRLQHDWTQARLAVRVGLSAASVSMVESGKRCLRANQLPTFADALGVNVASLLLPYVLFREGSRA